MNVYKTVAGFGEAEITEKKSRFIAHVSPIENENEATEFITKIKKKHYNARHNVSAYTIGLSGETVKAGDDGEPSGTAGVPILDILRKERINNCIVVVTRYFGGTLLGTGGLVRAYSLAAKKGLEAAGIIEMVLCSSYALSVDYHTYGKIQYELEKKGFRVKGSNYADDVTIDVIIEAEREGEFLKMVSLCCAGRETLLKNGEDYFCLD